MPIQFFSLPSTCRDSRSYPTDLPWHISCLVLTNSNEQIIEKIFLLTVSRWQKKSIDMTRFAVTEGAADPHTAWGLCFPETGDVLQLLLQEKTVFRYCGKNGLNGLVHDITTVHIWLFVQAHCDILEHLVILNEICCTCSNLTQLLSYY